MNLQKIAPFNWLKRETETGREFLPAAGEKDPFSRMHREMDRMFEDFFGNTRPASGTVVLRPNVDIAESKKAYRISVDVPGMEPDQIELRIDDDMLVLSGEKRRESEEDDEGFHRIERNYGQFRRVLTLPEDADAEHIKADFKNGVLKIMVPRIKQSGKPDAKKIPIDNPVDNPTN